MKLKQIILAAALVAGLANVSNAATTVYLTGSTAMRSTVYSALIASNAVFTAVPTYTVYQGGTSNNNAGNGGNFMAFSGTLVGGSGTTIIQCHWTGSEAGIVDVVSNTVVVNTFMDSASMDGADHGTNVPTTISAAVNLAMADNDQAYSRTKKPALTSGAEVGIITFKWVRNPGWFTGTNVTDSMIKQALRNQGTLAVFTGNAADTSSYVYVSGRDNQSGTRVNALGDSGYGILTTPQQIEMNSLGVMQLIGGVYIGDLGYSSGGTLAGTLGAVTTNATDSVNGGSGYSVISYLSVGDAATAIGKGATELAYNGVPFSAAAVKEGTYTYWGNEYIYKANNVVSASDADKVYGRLVTSIPTYCDGTKAIALSAMNCARTGPTTDPVHN